MQYSGILVLLRTEDFATGLQGLRALEGVEVHHEEPATGRVVVVSEADSPRNQEEVLGRLRRVAGVVVAEPVYFYEPDGDDVRGEADPAALDGSGTPGANTPVEEDGP